MSAIITEKFRQHNANQFFESFTETAGNTYYLFLGKATPFTSGTTTGSDSSPPTPQDGEQDETRAWDAMLAAKKIASTDITYAIPRRNWVNGTTYDMYEHNISSANTSTSGASNIYDSTFYFVTSDYRVYKVLDNGGGVAYDGAEPTSTSTSPFELGGYVLKYMYDISTTDIGKYVTTDFIPVATDSTVSTAALDGAIESLTITAGSGYTDGTYYAAVYGDGTSQGTSSGAIIRITVSSGAIASFGLTAGTDTTVHAAGAAYTYGYVNLDAGYTFSDTGLTSASNIGGSGGVINVVISPEEGHGNNAVTELGGHYIMSASTITQAENDDFSTANDFRQVGIVVDPTTYGTTTVASSTTARQTNVVRFASYSGTFEADEVITQASTGATGVPSSESSETVTLANSNTLTLTSGYANPELQPDSGDIIYLENRKPIQRASDQTEDIKIIIEF